MGADPMEFGKYQILKPEQRRISFRYADEVLYATGVYLMSLEPPKNPDSAPAALIERGRELFARETCINCHAPSKYTSGKLTLAQGYTLPSHHPNEADIVNRSVGTDPGLAMKTRKGTGFYKIPSLRGVWYRPLLLHDGSVASLGRDVRSRSAQARSRTRRMERARRHEAADPRPSFRARAERRG